MSIRITVPPGLQVFTESEDTVEVNGTTVGECLEYLTERFPAIESVLFFQKGELFNFGYNRVSVYVNGEDNHPDEPVTPLKDGDTIQILYSISGG